MMFLLLVRFLHREDHTPGRAHRRVWGGGSPWWGHACCFTPGWRHPISGMNQGEHKVRLRRRQRPPVSQPARPDTSWRAWCPSFCATPCCCHVSDRLEARGRAAHPCGLERERGRPRPGQAGPHPRQQQVTTVPALVATIRPLGAATAAGAWSHWALLVHLSWWQPLRGRGQPAVPSPGQGRLAGGWGEGGHMHGVHSE